MPKQAPIPQNQFTWLDQAVQFAVRADMAGVGGGVMPIDDTDGYHNEVSGIYLPPWTPADGALEPSEGDKRQFLIRYKNKANDGTHVGGMNIGLYIEMALGHAVYPDGHAGPGAPPNWDYAVKFAKQEADARLIEMNGPQP